MARVLNVGSNLYLDLEGSNVQPGTNIIVYPLNDPLTPNQEWHIKQEGATDKVKIYCTVSGHDVYIRINGTKAVATSDVNLATKFTRKSEGSNTIFSLDDNNLQVPSNASARTQVEIAAKNDSDYQRWNIITPRDVQI